MSQITESTGVTEPPGAVEETESVGSMQPGQLLAKLEACQDAAMVDLEALDFKLIRLLRELGATPVEDDDVAATASETIQVASPRRTAA